VKRTGLIALTIAFSLIGLFFVDSTSAERPDVAVAPVKLKISRYTTVTLTNSEADTIIADGVKLLKDKDGSDDVSCTIDLSRDGNVTTFTTGNGIINTKADYDAICALAGRIHMVKQINYCAGRTSPNIIGCADVSGTCMILVRTAADLEGVLWMHEYGHNAGLNHRNVAKAVMNETIDNTCKRINSTECDAYKAATLMTPDLRSQIQLPGSSVEEFVHKVYVHGVPYEPASKFPSSDVPQLLRMLADPNEQPYWSNIVATLGAIGDVRAAKPLIDFLTGGTGNLSEEHFKAKTAVLMSLGYLINKSRDPQSLDFLLRSLNPNVWAERIKWRAPFPEGVANQRIHLTALSIWGLALSGTTEAGEALRALKRPARTASERRVKAALINVIDEALALHEKVVRLGLIEMYKQLQ
jgi:hypothetical protein